MSRKREPNSVAVLLRIPVFRRLWAAIAVSSLGDWLGLLATTALAAYLTKDSSNLAQGAAVSGVLLTRLLPDLILGPIAGALVDRFDRRMVAIIGDSLAGLLYVSIIFCGNLLWLLVAQFLVEAIGLFSTPAKQAMWVNIVPRERLAVANQLNYVSVYGMVPVAAALFALLSTAASFFGVPDLSGGSTALISGSTNTLAIDIALAIDAGTYCFSAFMVFISRRLIPSFVGDRSTTKNIFSLIAEGVSFVRKNRLMRSIYIGILGAFGAGGLVAGVAQAYVATLGAGNAGYGILFGSVFTGLALGMLIGPKVLPTVPRRMIFTPAIGAAGHLAGRDGRPAGLPGRRARRVGDGGLRRHRLDQRVHHDRARGVRPAPRPGVRVRHVVGADRAARHHRRRPGAGRRDRVVPGQGRRLPVRHHRARHRAGRRRVDRLRGEPVHRRGRSAV